MWTGLLFTVTIIVISYFSGLYFGTVYQKAVYKVSIHSCKRTLDPDCPGALVSTG